MDWRRVRTRFGAKRSHWELGTEGIRIRCGVASLVTVDHDVILTADIVNDLMQLSVASVCNMQVC